MTKTEQSILARVRDVNDRGALRGLGVSPHDAHYVSPQWRFVRRLCEAGQIRYVDWTPKLGAGWLLAGRNPLDPKEDAP